MHRRQPNKKEEQQTKKAIAEHKRKTKKAIAKQKRQKNEKHLKQNANNDAHATQKYTFRCNLEDQNLMNTTSTFNGTQTKMKNTKSNHNLFRFECSKANMTNYT